MEIIETRWRFEKPLACKIEICGATYECDLGKFNAIIMFPEINTSPNCDRNKNDLIAPYDSNSEITEEHLYQWGWVADTNGNVFIHQCVIRIFIDSIEELNSKKEEIKIEINEWFKRFFFNCHIMDLEYILNHPECSEDDIKHEIVLWKKNENNYLETESRNISISICIHLNAYYLEEGTIQNSIDATNKYLIPFFARKLLYYASNEHRQGQYRTSILYSAISCEVALTYKLHKNGIEKIKNLKQKFIKVSQLETNVLNNSNYDLFIENRNKCIHEGIEITRDDSLNGLLIAKRLLEECPMWE